jgi:hypothetical protein
VIGAICLCCIEEGYATVEGGMDEVNRFLLIGGRAIIRAQSHAAEPECRNLQSIIPEFAPLHFAPFIDGYA